MKNTIAILFVGLSLFGCKSDRKNQIIYGSTPPAVTFLFDASGIWMGSYTTTDDNQVVRTFPITLELQHANLRSLAHSYIGGSFDNGEHKVNLDVNCFGTGDGMVLHFIGRRIGLNPTLFIDMAFEGKLTDYPDQKMMAFTIKGSDQHGHQKGSGTISRP